MESVYRYLGQGIWATFLLLYASQSNLLASFLKQTEMRRFQFLFSSNFHIEYSWIITAHTRSQGCLVLNLIKITNPLQRMSFFTRFLTLLLLLFQCFYCVIMTWGWCFVLFLLLYQFVQKCLLLRIWNFQFFLQGPIFFVLVSSRTWVLFTHLRLIIEKVSSFCHVFPAFLPLLQSC